MKFNNPVAGNGDAITMLMVMSSSVSVGWVEIDKMEHYFQTCTEQVRERNRATSQHQIIIKWNQAKKPNIMNNAARTRNSIKKKKNRKKEKERKDLPKSRWKPKIIIIQTIILLLI